MKETPESKFLEKNFEPTVKRVGINKVAIREDSAFGLSTCAAGASLEYYRKEGARTILISPGLMNVDPHASSAIMKHELGHLKAQDAKTLAVVEYSCSIISAGIISRALKCIPRFQALFAVVGAVASYFAPSVIRDPVTRWREECADDFSVANSNEDEKMGGYRALHASRVVNRKLRERLEPKLDEFFSPEGDSLFDRSHPSLFSRAEKFKQHMNKESLKKLSTEEERRKIETLAVYNYISQIVDPHGGWTCGGDKKNGVEFHRRETYESWASKGQVTYTVDYTYNPQGQVSTKSTHWQTPTGDILETSSFYEYDGDEISNIVSTANGRFAKEPEV